MKHVKVLLSTAMLAAIGSSNAFADTTLLTEANGWKKITSISQTDISNNYYVFVANDEDLMLGIGNSTNQGNKNAMFYQSSVDPVKDLSKVWYLEPNGNDYAVRNFSNDYLQFQTEYTAAQNSLNWRNNDQSTSISWTGLRLNYANGSWSLLSTQYSRPLGLYNNDTGKPAEGKELGANDVGKGQQFQIYAISRVKLMDIVLAGATSESPKDATAFILNNDFNNYTNYNKKGDQGWTVTGSGGNYNFNGAIEIWHRSNFSFGQTLFVPNGEYTVTAQMVNGEGAYTAALYASSGGTTKQSNVNTSCAGSNFAAQRDAFAKDANYGQVSVNIIVKDNKLNHYCPV